MGKPSRRCIVEGCSTGASEGGATGGGVTYHRLPQGHRLRQKWARALQQPLINAASNRHRRICSRHFDGSCFQKRGKVWQLRPGSVPIFRSGGGGESKGPQRMVKLEFPESEPRIKEEPVEVKSEDESGFSEGNGEEEEGNSPTLPSPPRDAENGRRMSRAPIQIRILAAKVKEELKEEDDAEESCAPPNKRRLLSSHAPCKDVAAAEATNADKVTRAEDSDSNESIDVETVDNGADFAEKQQLFGNADGRGDDNAEDKAEKQPITDDEEKDIDDPSQANNYLQPPASAVNLEMVVERTSPEDNEEKRAATGMEDLQDEKVSGLGQVCRNAVHQSFDSSESQGEIDVEAIDSEDNLQQTHAIGKKGVDEVVDPGQVDLNVMEDERQEGEAVAEKNRPVCSFLAPKKRPCSYGVGQSLHSHGTNGTNTAEGEVMLRRAGEGEPDKQRIINHQDDIEDPEDAFVDIETVDEEDEAGKEVEDDAVPRPVNPAEKEPTAPLPSDSVPQLSEPGDPNAMDESGQASRAGKAVGGAQSEENDAEVDFGETEDLAKSNCTKEKAKESSRIEANNSKRHTIPETATAKSVIEKEFFTCLLCAGQFSSHALMMEHELREHFPWAVKPHDLTLTMDLVEAVKTGVVEGGHDCKLRKRLMAILHEFETTFNRAVACPKCSFKSRNRDVLIGHFKVSHVTFDELVKAADDDGNPRDQTELTGGANAAGDGGDGGGGGFRGVTINGGAGDHGRDHPRRPTHDVSRGNSARDVRVDPHDRDQQPVVGGELGRTGPQNSLKTAPFPGDAFKGAGQLQGQVRSPGKDSASGDGTTDDGRSSGNKCNNSNFDGDVQSSLTAKNERAAAKSNGSPPREQLKEDPLGASSIAVPEEEEGAGSDGDHGNDFHVSAVTAAEKEAKQRGSTECYFCDQSFTSTAALTQHLQSAHFADLKCNLCTSQLSSWWRLVAHLDTEHSLGFNGHRRQRCAQCNKTFGSHRSLEGHKNIRCLRCNLCQYTFKAASVQELVEHKKKVHNVSRHYLDSFASGIPKARRSQSIFRLDCGLCKQTFASPRETSRHLWRQHYADLKCQLCDHASRHKWELKQHLSSRHNKSPHGEELLVCRFCGDGFATDALLHAHHQTRCKGLRCNRCTFVASDLDDVRHHALKEHNLCAKSAGNPFFYCHQCQLQLKNWSTFRKHNFQMHSKGFRCKKCSFECETCRELKLHLQAEHGLAFGLMRHVCNHCKKEFQRTEALRKHLIEQHFPDFKCHLCDFESPSLSVLRLRDHMMKTHCLTLCGHRGFPCHSCHHIATSAASLTLHVKGKHGEKYRSQRLPKTRSISKESLLCVRCGAAFPDQHRLDRHELVRHSTQLRCSRCRNFATGCQQELNRHLILCHPEFCKWCSLPLEQAETSIKGFNRRNSLAVGHECPAQFGPGPLDGQQASALQRSGRRHPQCSFTFRAGEGSVCAKCGFRSSRSQSGPRHERLMHRSQACPHPRCALTASHRAELLAHLREAHKDTCAVCAFVGGGGGGDGVQPHSCEEQLFFGDAAGDPSCNPMLAQLGLASRPSACLKCRRIFPCRGRRSVHKCLE